MKSLTTIACISALLALFCFPVLAVIGLICGLVIFVRGKAAQGMALLLVSAVCGGAGMMLDLPYGEHLWQMITNTTRMAAAEANSKSATAPAATWTVVALDSKVSKPNHGQSVCEWKLVVRNDSQQVAVYRGVVEFQDANGTKLFEAKVNPEGTQVAPQAEGTFTGAGKISSDQKVARAVPKLELAG